MGYPDNWDSLRREVYSRDDYTCQECGEKGGNGGSAELHAHHITPKSQAGGDEKTNLKTLCKSCHNDKHAHDITEKSSSTSKKSRQQPERDPLRDIADFIFSIPFATAVAIKDILSIVAPTMVVGLFLFCNALVTLVVIGSLGAETGLLVGVVFCSVMLIFAAADASMFPRKTLTAVLFIGVMSLASVRVNPSYTLNLGELFPIQTLFEFNVVITSIILLVLFSAGVCGGIERKFLPDSWAKKLALTYRLSTKIRRSLE